jgi:hypothetical protein
MKKAWITGLLLGLSALPLFAHGHDGNGHRNGICYSGHAYNDGHNWHEICPVNNCNETGVHSHNGRHYFSKAHR